MGCVQSKVENEESVTRCKDRKILMKEAVTARNAFAAAHSGYAMSLKNTGAALSDYAYGEADPSSQPQYQNQQPPPSIDNLPPPPPPLPSFSPSPSPPIKRAISLPAMKQRAPRDFDSLTIAEEEEEEEEEEGLNHGGRNGIETEEEEDGTKQQQIEHAQSVPSDFMRVRKKGGNGVDLMQVLGQIDDHFLRSSESAQEVCKMLEATRLHYHSNFADNRGHIDHSARVMRVITWNRSFKGISGGGEGVAKDDFESEDHETHATVLDKLLAWEKKLYDEVKQGELMKLEYKRKVALLNKQKKRGASAESLEKTKAAVSHLHTRYIVDMQSMDSTVSEVNRIRDEQLYPKLVSLVEGMSKMWGSMSIHHDSQLKIVTDLKSLEVTDAIKETSRQHHEQTTQLCDVVEKWNAEFEKLVSHQKQYINYLNSWLKLNLIPIESSLKEKISSPPRVQNPPIQPLLQAWHDHLERLPDELAKSAISSFAAVIRAIKVHQEEEMKLKEKCEETRKEYIRKRQGFEEWHQKYVMRRAPSEEGDGDRVEDGGNPKDPVAERQFAVESLQKKLEEEVEAHQRHCLQVREKSLGSLKIRLPELFRAMSDYSHTCYDAYERLKSITQTKNANRGPPRDNVS
ncbi:Protein ROLLING AND ERECT LEAF 2 [Linum perenne]